MFWIKKDTVERKLADVMGFEYCTLFDSARSALRAWREARRDPTYPWRTVRHDYPVIPSNVCLVLREVLEEVDIIPVNPSTGLAPGVAIQLYGYRNEVTDGVIEIDPLMTGFLRRPLCAEAIISFGHKKMLDIGGGGALLSNKPFKVPGYFPDGLRENLTRKLNALADVVLYRRKLIDRWDRLLGDSCVRIPQEQIMPWRVIRRIPEKRDIVVKALREAGHAVGTNYPPLPGVTDAGAIQWGNEVINFFPEEEYPDRAANIVKKVLQ